MRAGVDFSFSHLLPHDAPILSRIPSAGRLAARSVGGSTSPPRRSTSPSQFAKRVSSVVLCGYGLPTVGPRVQHAHPLHRSQTTSQDGDALTGYLAECRALVLREIGEMMPRVRHGQRLYELMRDYPLRGGKALRPALCIAVCRALGGYLESVLRTAAAIELYHNAFLVHDDVEDRSELAVRTDAAPQTRGADRRQRRRRDAGALDGLPARQHRIIGVGKTLRILECQPHGRESAEGQMMELDWISRRPWKLTDQSYIRMVYKKTTWYSFIAPVHVGAIAAGASSDRDGRPRRFATQLGIAFQIQDDVLNLVGTGYGRKSRATWKASTR